MEKDTTRILLLSVDQRETVETSIQLIESMATLFIMLSALFPFV